MKVLMVSEVYTHPHDMGNRQRIYHECYQMRELGWQVDFLYLGGRRTGDIEQMINFFGKEHFYFASLTGVIPIYQLKGKIRKELDEKGFSKYISLFYNVDEKYYWELNDQIQSILRREKYDIIWLQYEYQSKVLDSIGNNVFKIVDTHDVFAYRNFSYQKQGRIPEGFYVTRRQERKALSRADLVLAIQQEEEVYFKKLLRKQDTQCMTLGDMVEYHESKDGKKNVFGFIGAENDANVVGVKWLENKVLPVVCERIPESRCLIAGGICEKIPDSKYYIKVGKVSLLQEYYNKIQIAVNPIQNGTGLNIKGIEALSYGKPLVSTIVGAKGLSDAVTAMAVCENAHQFADRIVALLRDGDRRFSMHKEAEMFINRYNEKNRNALLKIAQMAMEKVRI